MTRITVAASLLCWLALGCEGSSGSGTGELPPGTGGHSAPPGSGGATSGTGGNSSGGGTAGDSGAGGTGGSASDLSTPTCTSNKTWTGGTDGSNDMQPGVACIACHRKSGGEAPTFAVAGTVYPTVHEPDQCYGVNGTTGVRVVITGADGAVITLTPSTSGNFSFQGSLAQPFTAKVTDMNGGERVMSESQTTGDCNGCHTQAGSNSAPGRIIAP